MRNIFFTLLLALPFQSFCQTIEPTWVQALQTENPDPGVVIDLYESYYKTHPFVKNTKTQEYKRWIRSFSRPEKFDLEDSRVKAYIKASKKLAAAKDTNSAWVCVGPKDFDIDAASRSYAPGAAHVYTVERSLSLPNVLYAGTATTGLWKSVNSGGTWASVTKNELVNSIRAIEIHPINSNIVYFGSGGKLYRTLDGGTTWNTIGDANFQALDHGIPEIIISPASPNLLFVTSDNGFYRSVDGGDNFTEIMTGEFQEIEFNPSDAQMIYTIKIDNSHSEFYRSTDGGLTFVQQTNGWPLPTGATDHQERVEIAVSPANASIIYANATGKANGGSGTYGIYKSIDTGLTWTFECCGTQPSGPASLANINMMGWDKEGEDDGGQYYYDVALAVDPTDANKLHLGGVNHWVSTDGGVNWICPAKWSEPALDNYVHADIHDIRFLNGELWIACDGGVFKSTDGGTTIDKSMLGIEGSDFWGFGVSPQSDVMLGGAYHNGTLLKDNSTYINDWICTGGGDGVRGFVNFGNDRIAYDDYKGRKLSGDRTQNIQGFAFDSLPNASYIVGVSSDMAWDPRNYNHIYLGRGLNLLKTEDNGASYSIIYTFADNVAAVEIARSNLDVMYVTTYENWWGAKKVWRSNNGGTSWTDITPSAALLNGVTWVPYDIAVSGTNENEIWLARTSQYSSYPDLDNKNIFKSIDGGTTWTNYSTPTIDGEWITNIVHQAGTDGGVYIGTRRTVYYRNNSMNDWALFNVSLPLSTASTKLVTKYKTQRLINATNRSIHEVEFYEPSAPIAQIAVDKFKANCIDNEFRFVDHSVLSDQNPTWQWTFPGGTPSSSTQQNPIIVYATSGFHDVTLTVTDDFGTSTQAYLQFVELLNPTVTGNLNQDFELIPLADWTLKNDNNTFNWGSKKIANGPDCDSSQVMWINNFAINQVGDEAELISPKVDLSNVSAASLFFDYAYAHYGGAYSDGMRVDISTDCWLTYDTLFLKIGDSLQTVPDDNTTWTPADCADWEKDYTIDISAYSGQEVMVRFVGINAWGNNLYLDNVNIQTNLSLAENGSIDFNIYPNPSNGNFKVVHSLSKPSIQVLSLEGKLVYSGKLSKSVEQVNLDLAAGTYLVKIEENGHQALKRLVIR